MGSTEQEINTNDFFCVLKIACHVEDLIQDKNLLNSAFTDFYKLNTDRAINELIEIYKNRIKFSNIYINKMETKLSKHDVNICCKCKVLSNNTLSKAKCNTKTCNCESDQRKEMHQQFTKKINAILDEGVLDSVLPYVCPALIPNNQTQSVQKPIKLYESCDGNSAHSKSFACVQTECIGKGKGTQDVQNVQQRRKPEPDSTKEMKMIGKKKSQGSPIISNNEITNQDVEVIIHVCDEIKNTTQDFTCPQKLLVNKMGYFANVTSGQKLEDMDISVHCDIQIFEWLMKWIKKNVNQSDSPPQLDATNVVPILVSASFLQMEPLLLDCLSFCHARLTDIVRTSANLSCLNDSIITRLAAMFTNLELEVVKDKKDRITPRLWIKLIQNLCEPEPQTLRGHYYSVIGLYRCSRCCQFLTQTMNSYVTCVPSNIRLNRWGQLVSQHTRELSWDLSKYITSLFKELKSWRKVYWKLWGHSHFLYCSVCECHFPIYQMTWCRYHPDGPHYVGSMHEGRITGPTGRYPCCGQQAFRYESSHGPNGCQFREHNILVENDRDRAIMNLLQIATEGGNLLEISHGKHSEMLFSNSVDFKWAGLRLMPIKCRPGLLPALNQSENHIKFSRKLRISTSNNIESSSETDTSNTIDISRRCPSRIFSFSSDGCESDGNDISKIIKINKKRHVDHFGRFWSGDLSARSNQDHQREYEEKLMKHVTASGNTRTNIEVNNSQCIASICGTYHKLESEWKEQLKQKNALKLKFK